MIYKSGETKDPGSGFFRRFYSSIISLEAMMTKENLDLSIKPDWVKELAKETLTWKNITGRMFSLEMTIRSS